MVATAYTVNLVFKRGNAVVSREMTVSDVVAAAGVFEDGQDLLTLPAGVWILSDAVCSNASTDTTKLEIYANQKSSGEFIYNKQNQLTTIGRQFQVAPRRVAGNVPLRFVQRA